MKKFLALTLTILLVMSALPCVVMASTYGNLTYSLSNNQVTITGFVPDGSTELVIPDTIEGYPVTSIEYYSLAGCECTNITLPSSLTNIGEAAFYDCSNLTSIEIPDSVITIGEGAFDECVNLESVTIGNGVTTIGESAFYNCEILESVTIGNSVTTIGDYAFSACGILKSIIIPNSVITIGESAFMNCDCLESVTIGNSVTTIGDYAFNTCGNLKSIIIPNSVITIGNYAFSGSSDLESVTIGSGITNINDGAFGYCYSITDVYYCGSETQWGDISIGSYNDCITDDESIHYNAPMPYYDSGYFSSELDSTFKEGIIAFTSQFTQYTDCDASEIESFGMYIYKPGVTGDDRTQLSSENGFDLADNEGWIYSFVTEIDSSDFNNPIYAMPYIVISGETYFGCIITAKVNGTKEICDISEKPSFLE